MPNLFEEEIIKKNVRYYENRTIHDSSLSYCAHAIASARIGDTDLAYEFFKKAMEIDLNDNFSDSTDGIHSAALGGNWNCIVQGFAGVKIGVDYVEITPHLPKTWEELQFYLKIRGHYIKIRISNRKVILETEEPLDMEFMFLINGKYYSMKNKLEVSM
jgi:hypothetical glycosyl hydrolase